MLSTEKTIAYWVAVNSASIEPMVERLSNRAWFDGSRVIVYTYVDEVGDADGDLGVLRGTPGERSSPG